MATYGIGSSPSIIPPGAFSRLDAVSPDELRLLAEIDPALYARVRAKLDFTHQELEREEYEDSLIAFMKRAWREIDPAPLSINWHHEVIADHLEMVTAGELRNLVINVPPRPVADSAIVECRGRGRVPLSDIRVGDHVMAHKGVWRRVTEVHERGEMPCLRVHTAAGGTLDLTPDHPVLTQVGWVEAWTLRAWHVVRRFDGEQTQWDTTVLRVEPIGLHPCRCLAVEGDNSFLANGIAVHNCSKSLETNVLWPAWVWAQPSSRQGPLSGPQVSFLCVSYGATLAEEIALKMRRLVMGDWYQSLWGDRVRVMDDQQSRANFATTAGGERISASVEGGLLGRGGDIQIHDDIISPGEANSQIERERVMRAISEGLATRVKNPRTAARVMVMQRLHMEDPTNYALDNWRPAPVHLMFPMRFDSNRACELDPRTVDGELLWPQVWDEGSVSKTEMELGDYGAAAQFQQSPIPRAGGIVSRDDWQIWPEWTPRVEDMRLTRSGVAVVPLPSVSHVLVSLDTALSEKETADWTACIVWGVWHRPKHLTQIVGQNDRLDDGEQPRVIMMGAWRVRAKLNDDSIDPRTGEQRGVVQRLIATALRFNADRIVIENKTRGLDVKNEIERQVVDMPFQIELFEPNRHGDKVARLHSVQPLFSQKLVYAPANCRLSYDANGNEFVDVQEFVWARDVMNEMEQVPKGAHDDFADCASMSLITLRNDGYLALTQEYIAEQMRMRLHRPRKTTVRDSYGV